MEKVLKSLEVVWAKLEGKKTYLVSILFAVFNLLMVLGVFSLTPEQLIAVDGVFVALFGVSFKSALTTASK